MGYTYIHVWVRTTGKYRVLHPPPPKERFRPRNLKQSISKLERKLSAHLWLKLPWCFTFIVMLPLNLRQQNLFVSEFLHFMIQNSHWSFIVGHIIVDFNIGKSDLVLWIVHTSSQHTDVKYIVHPEHLRWQCKSICHLSYTFQNFKRSE